MPGYYENFQKVSIAILKIQNFKNNKNTMLNFWGKAKTMTSQISELLTSKIRGTIMDVF